MSAEEREVDQIITCNVFLSFSKIEDLIYFQVVQYKRSHSWIDRLVVCRSSVGIIRPLVRDHRNWLEDH